MGHTKQNIEKKEKSNKVECNFTRIALPVEWGRQNKEGDTDRLPEGRLRCLEKWERRASPEGLSRLRIKQNR